MPQKILAIDDSHTLRLFIKNTLSDNFPEHVVLMAVDGKDGVAQAQREIPDVILLDFLMPEMRGDQVCEALLANPATASIPIVLMSSSAVEIQATQTKYSNVVRAVAKPFTPDLLCSTVGFVLRQHASALPEAAPDPVPATSPHAASVPTSEAEDQEVAFTAPADLQGIESVGDHTALLGRGTSDFIIYRGKTSHTPLRGVLSAIQDEKLTGVLRLHLKDHLLLAYFAKGRPLLCTTPNVKFYLRSSQLSLPPSCKQGLEEAKQHQAVTGCPLFITLAECGALTKASALTLTYQHTRKLFARTWISNRINFEFLRMQQVPAFAHFGDPYPGNVDEWAMESLRMIGEEALSAIAWGEPNGIPTFTREGYEQIQQIALLDEEIQFASLVSNNLSLQDICLHMQIPVEKAQQILFRFLCLQMFTYWPASLLRGTSQQAA